MFIKQLLVYPVKSLSPLQVSKWEVTERGLKYDRKWMLVDEKGTFITQRKYPQLVHIGVDIKEQGLVFHHDKESVEANFNSFNIHDRAKVWEDEVTILKSDSHADQFFSNYLNIKCSLVMMQDDALRERKYNKGKVNLSDRLPFLVVNNESVNWLNKQFSSPVTPLHFRPNIIVDGVDPFEEDSWKSFGTSSVKMIAESQCMRCKMINVNPLTGEVSEKPLQELAAHRKMKDGVAFGVLASPVNTGILRVNEQIDVKL